MKKHKTKILVFIGALMIILGLFNIGWSSITTSRGYATSYKLTCSELLIGASCEGYVRRGGGGDCGYNIHWYSAFSKTGESELYLPLTTCGSTVKVLTPIVDLTFARVFFAILTTGGLILILSPFLINLKARR